MSEREENFLQYLPPVLWEEDRDFIERFLHIFEDIFGDIETKVDGIPRLFNPWTTPVRYLPWLASWVALELEPHWTEIQSRAFIRNIVSLYNQRGTLKSLEKYLRIYVGSNVSINELPLDTSPHEFDVTINFPSYDYQHLIARVRRIRAIIDREKPAHTYYHLDIKSPPMQIGVHSTIGVDTILGKL